MNISSPTYTLDQLMAELETRYGQNVEIKQVSLWGFGLGRDFELWKDGVKRATWSSYLKEVLPLDKMSTTARGPSEYFDLIHL